MPLYTAVMHIEEVEGVRSVIPVENRSVGIKIRCTDCNEVTQKYIYIDPSEEVEVRGGGTHQMAFKCSFCSALITGDIVCSGMYMCDSSDENSECVNNAKNDNRVFTLDIRNGVPVELELDDQWVVVAESGAKFEDADLSQDWCEFDEPGCKSLAILGVRVDFKKMK